MIKLFERVILEKRWELIESSEKLIMKYESQIFLILIVWGVPFFEVGWRDTEKYPKIAKK